jgi:hypothetical protein
LTIPPLAVRDVGGGYYLPRRIIDAKAFSLYIDFRIVALGVDSLRIHATNPYAGVLYQEGNYA